MSRLAARCLMDLGMNILRICWMVESGLSTGVREESQGKASDETRCAAGCSAIEALRLLFYSRRRRAGQSGGAGVSCRLSRLWRLEWPSSRPGRVGRSSSRLHESLWFCSRHLCLDPDRGRQSRGQRRGGASGVLDQVADSDIVLFPELCVTGYTCADLFGQTTLLDGGLRGVRPDRRGPRRGDASSWSSACRSRWATVLYNCAAVVSRRQGPGDRPQAVPAQLQGVLREPLVPPGDGTEPPEIELARRPRARSGSTCSSSAGGRGHAGRGGHRDLRGPLGADPAQLGPGAGRGDGPARTSPPATRRSARAATAPTWWWASRAAASRPTPTPARARRSRRPTWSSAATA